MPTLAQILSTARSAGLDKLDCDLLLLLALGYPAPKLHGHRAWLMAHDDAIVSDTVHTRFRALVSRRGAGEPQAYLTGYQDFYGMSLAVDPRVLIPRPDSETLVDWAVALLGSDPGNANPTPRRLLDLGTGSGAIALALKRALPTLSVDAVDASASALAVARVNARGLGLDVALLHGSWFEPVTGRYACIVSNPPYVAQGDPHLAALAHEPAGALVSGPDGLNDIRAIVVGAPSHLMPGGWLLLEHGFEQGSAVWALMVAAGFLDVSHRCDLAGHWRCTGGQWPG